MLEIDPIFHTKSSFLFNKMLFCGYNCVFSGIQQIYQKCTIQFVFEDLILTTGSKITKYLITIS